MRAVNLIPKDQRRGEGGLATGRSGIAVYALLGVLALAVVAVGYSVLSSNRINDRKERLADLKREEASSRTAAEALRPYGTFAQLQEARIATVNALVESSFNWERVMRSLSRTIPSDVWLTDLKATLSTEVDVGGGGGSTGALRDKAPQSPAVEMSGCTYSQKAVARMMVRMRNIDGVSEVVLGQSERPQGEQAQQSAAPADGAGGGGGNAAAEAGGDCRTKYHITKFELLVVLGNAKTAAPQVAAAGGGTAPAPVAGAQAAASAQSQPAGGQSYSPEGGAASGGTAP